MRRNSILSTATTRQSDLSGPRLLIESSLMAADRNYERVPANVELTLYYLCSRYKKKTRGSRGLAGIPDHATTNGPSLSIMCKTVYRSSVNSCL